METFSPILIGKSKINSTQATNIAKIKAWAQMPFTTNRKVMASAPTVTTGGAATLAQYWPAVSPSASSAGDREIPGGWVTYVKAGNIDALSAGSTSVWGQNIQLTGTPTYTGSGFGVLLTHTGADIEFRMYTAGTAYCLFKVNGEYVSLTPTTISSTFTFVKLAFGSSDTRTIEVIMEPSGESAAFGGIYTAATDTIAPATPRGPRTVLVGDSFSIGVDLTYTQLDAFSTVLGDYLGWDDIRVDGIGGTGYLATNGGANLKFRDRLTRGVIAQNPECVIVTGGINDKAADAAALYTEALTYFQAIKAALPNVLLIVVEPFWSSDCSTFRSATSNIIPIRNAIRNAASAAGATFVGGFLEGDIPYEQTTARTGTLFENTATTNAAQTQFRSTTYFPDYSTVEIGNTDATKNRVMIASSSYGSGRYTYTIFASATATIYGGNLSGETITQVGNSLWRGTGRVGATTTVGNCDVLILAGGLHHTVAGHKLIASQAAQGIKKALVAL